ETVNYYLAPYERRELILSYPDNYTIEIYENDNLMEIKYLTTSSTLQTLIYERIDLEIVYLTYYDSNNEYLDFNLFTTYVNYTLDEFTYTNERLSSNILYVDDNSLIEFDIYDSFNVIVKSYQSYEETFIDITLDVYNLKIKNEALEYVNYSLQKGSISKEGNIFSGEIVDFYISSGNYILAYINHEDDSNHIVYINLEENQIITINSTYFDVYFALFNFDGLGLNHDLVRFYVNGIRKDFGFNTLKQDINNLKVLDYFNATLFDQAINLRQFTEYNIFVEIFTLIINNNYSQCIKVKIERDNSDFILENVIPAKYGMSFMFLPNIEYTITAYDLEGNKLERRYIKLDEHNKLVSFGFYLEEVPDIPPMTDTGNDTLILAFSFGSGIVIIGISLIWLLSHQNKKKKRRH
ncbi:MAG: hypothetical protein ACFFDF_22600, partial [Candidatus Odinarchaeota archaeon]